MTQSADVQFQTVYLLLLYAEGNIFESKSYENMKRKYSKTFLIDFLSY